LSFPVLDEGEDVLETRVLVQLEVELDERMVFGMRGEWKSFAVFAKVCVGAVRVHALVSNTHNLLVASIADSRVQDRTSLRSTKYIRGIMNSHERVSWVLLRYNPEARLADIEVWAVHALVTFADDPQFAHVACSGVYGWIFGGSGSRSSVVGNAVDNNFSRHFDLEEFMSAVVNDRCPINAI
jgi:hypothetical protein